MNSFRNSPSIPFPRCNRSIRKNSPLNSIDLLDLEHLEYTIYIWTNYIILKPLTFLSCTSNDSNQPFTNYLVLTFSKFGTSYQSTMVNRLLTNLGKSFLWPKFSFPILLPSFQIFASKGSALLLSESTPF